MAIEEEGIDQLIANVKAAKRQSICIVHGEKPKSGSESTRHRHRSIVGEACFYHFFYMRYSKITANYLLNSQSHDRTSMPPGISLTRMAQDPSIAMPHNANLSI